jgi:sporulation protein YlmC with PRC-barrel domain
MNILIECVIDITKQMQKFTQVEENKSFPWMTKGDQHKHKIDMQSSQVSIWRKKLLINYNHVEKIGASS